MFHLISAASSDAAAAAQAGPKVVGSMGMNIDDDDDDDEDDDDEDVSQGSHVIAGHMIYIDSTINELS